MIYFKSNLLFLIKRDNTNNSQLANKIGITRQSINDYIKNDKLPSIDTLIKLKFIFNVSIDDLLLKDLSKA